MGRSNRQSKALCPKTACQSRIAGRKRRKRSDLAGEGRTVMRRGDGSCHCRRALHFSVASVSLGMRQVSPVGCLAEEVPRAGLLLAPPGSVHASSSTRRSTPERLPVLPALGYGHCWGPGPGRQPPPGLPAGEEELVLIVGDGGCGKTTLLMVYSQGSFPEVRLAGGAAGR